MSVTIDSDAARNLGALMGRLFRGDDDMDLSIGKAGYGSPIGVVPTFVNLTINGHPFRMGAPIARLLADVLDGAASVEDDADDAGFIRELGHRLRGMAKQVETGDAA